MAGLHVPLSTLRHSPRGPSTHDSGPSWIATPSMSSALIPFLMPAYPGAFPTSRAEAADQAHVAFMPDTIWPVSGHPPDSSRAAGVRPGFDATCLRTRLSHYAAAEAQALCTAVICSRVG